MASKSKAKSAKKGGKTAAKKVNPAKQASSAEKSGDHVRVMPSEKLIVDLSNEMDKTLERTSTLSGTFGQTMKAAVEKGVNGPAFRLVKRFHRMAQRDPLKAAITREDFDFYWDILGLDKTLAKSMFPAAETRSGKKSASAKNGKNGDKANKQTELAMPPQELPPPEGGAERDADAPAVH
jgi:hypothetical protein